MNIDPGARMWTATLGLDGKLRAEQDQQRLAALQPLRARLAA